MKYFDKNTRKIAANWHQKQFDNDESRCYLKSKNLLKKKVRNFSYKIDDKLWWNALTEKEQIEVFREYYNEGGRYWYSSYASGGWSGYSSTITHMNNDMPNDEVISDEEHNRRIMELKEKFIPQTSRRRNLVIDDILK